MTKPAHLITDRKYLPSLEGWRGVMALLVVSFHFSRLFYWGDLTPYGYLGVDFFFILSGFIITRQYEASIALRTVSFRTFAIRRISRLYPLYLVGIISFLLVDAYIIEPMHHSGLMNFGMGPMFIYRIFLQLTMLGNLTVMTQPDGPVWSVSVEWIVNLLFFGAVWRYRCIPNLVLWAVVAISAIYLISMSPHTLQIPNATIIRGALGFTLGALLFRHHQSLPDFSGFFLHILEILIFLLAVALCYFHDYPFPVSVDYLFQLVLFPALLLISLYRKGWINRIFSLSLITFLGRISYSIYLLHNPLAFAMEDIPKTYPIGYSELGVLYVITLITLSTLTYLLIEKPFRILGHRLSKPSIK